MYKANINGLSSYNPFPGIPLHNVYGNKYGSKPCSSETVFHENSDIMIAPSKSDLTLFNATNMFRNDLNWKKFGEELQKRFSSEGLINTYVYACSTGSEAYTLSMLLQSAFPDDYTKFFPILAKDIDSEIIGRNKKEQEEKKIKLASGSRLSAKKHLDEDRIPELIDDETKQLSDRVIEPIEYSTADILKDVKNIDSTRPSIIMCRNMWYYVNQDRFRDYADELYKKVAPGSLVVTGSIDYSKKVYGKVNFPEALKLAGFVPVDNDISKIKGKDLVFEKPLTD